MTNANQELTRRLEELEVKQRRESALRGANAAVGSLVKQRREETSGGEKGNEDNPFLDDLETRLGSFGQVVAADAGKAMPGLPGSGGPPGGVWLRQLPSSNSRRLPLIGFGCPW